MVDDVSYMSMKKVASKTYHLLKLKQGHKRVGISCSDAVGHGAVMDI